MRHSLVTLAATSVVAAVSFFSANASAVVPSAPSVNAKSYILMDYKTGHVIAEGNADDAHGPASLTKMMTSYIIGHELLRGNISEDDIVTVSENAWARNFPGSSLMFIEVGRQVAVRDLNLGIIVSSGNDASVAMAEHIAGTEDAFADLMNAHAQRLGMTNTVFANSHGLPAPEQTTTARDMAILGQALIRDVPEEYALYSEREFTYNDIRQYNRNSLLWDRSLNVDGIKTGYTRDSGYSLVVSAVDGNTRLISVVMGADSERSRAAENKKLLNYGFRFFETVDAYSAGESFVEQRVWGGESDYVALGVDDDVVLTLPRGQRQNLKADFVLDRTLEAPIERGERVGNLILSIDGEDLATYPLVALESVEQGSFFKRMFDTIRQSFSSD